MTRSGAAGAGALPPETRANIRRSLLGGAAAFLALMLLSMLMLFTPVLDGDVAGVGKGYIAGFVDFALVLIGAVIHCARQNRAEGDVATNEVKQ